MNEILENIKNTKNLNLEKALDLKINENLNNFKKITEKAVVSGVEYAFKALDCNDEMKETVSEVKNAFKENNYKDLVGIAVESSLKLGLEIAKKKYPILKTLDVFKDISLKGGLSTFIGSTVDIAASKFLKGNLLNDEVKKFLSDIKSYIKGSAFVTKLEQGINKVKNKVDKFRQLCNKWYNAYEKFDINEINNVAKEVAKNTNSVSSYSEYLRENNIIQNMTKLINSKMDKLSKTQLEICSNL